MRSREYSKEKCEITMAANCVYLGKRGPSQKKSRSQKKQEVQERGKGKRRKEASKSVSQKRGQRDEDKSGGPIYF